MFGDDRGFFMETYSSRNMEAAGFPPTTFVQDNLSKSGAGTLRGLHYQINPSPMGKFVRCVQGSLFDVAVDLRKDSPTFGQWVGETLSQENGKALWVPGGFAHGFLTLEENTLAYYKCDGLYAPNEERSVNYADPEIGIEWPGEVKSISDKDEVAPLLKDADYNF